MTTMRFMLTHSWMEHYTQTHASLGLLPWHFLRKSSELPEKLKNFVMDAQTNGSEITGEMRCTALYSEFRVTWSFEKDDPSNPSPGLAAPTGRQ